MVYGDAMRVVVLAAALAGCGVICERDHVCEQGQLGGQTCDPNADRCFVQSAVPGEIERGACVPDGAGWGVCRPLACDEPPCGAGDTDRCPALCGVRVFIRGGVCVPPNDWLAP